MFFRKLFSAGVGAIACACIGAIIADQLGATDFLFGAAMLAGVTVGAYLGWKRPGAPKNKSRGENRPYTAGRSSRRGPDPHGNDAARNQAGVGDIHDRPPK